VAARTISRLEQELREQGAVLAARSDPGWESAAAAARLLSADDVDYLVIAARGTSDNAARYAQYLLGLDARLPVALAAPWLYAGGAPPPLLHRGAVLAISQSGRSPDVVAVVTAAHAQRRPTIALTNDVGSPLAQAADVVVPLLAGAERSVAATKTYLASLHAIAQISAQLVAGRDRSSAFARLPAIVSETVNEQLSERERFDRLDKATLLTVVGRGLQFPTAHETALKVRELSGIPAEAFSPPDLLHGPVAALNKSGVLWLVATHGSEHPDRNWIRAIARDVGLTVAVSDRHELLDEVDIGIPIVDGLEPWLAPMIAVIPGQAAALRLGELRGVELDRPHGLNKVTLTQ
jgi:glucosamine--fructose-6-phosphate aminotransferase (isomerizing)